MREKIGVLLMEFSKFLINDMHIYGDYQILLILSIPNSIRNSLSLKLGNSAIAMVRTSKLTTIVNRCGLLEFETILLAFKNTIVLAFS